MTTQQKRIWIFAILLVLGIRLGFFWKPDGEGQNIIRIFLLGNIIFLFFAALFIHLFFQYRHRTIKQMLQYIAESYSNNQISYSSTPVSLIKQHLYDTNNKSFLKTKNNNPDSKWVLLIVHEGQDCEFFHHLDSTQEDNLASVLIYYLQKDIPYEILYEHSKTIHSILSSQPQS